MRHAVNIVIAVAIVAASIALWRAGRKAAHESAADSSTVTTVTPAPNLPAAETSSATGSSATTATAGAPPPDSRAKGKQFADFQLRPFVAAKSSDRHEWTAEDGRAPDTILAIAHNQAEAERLLEENNRIERRQLVYRKEPAFVTVQRARAAGEPVRTLTVPGLDGEELEVEVVNADLDPSGLRGTFAGRLPGRGQSMVTLAFKEGREAFSVMSPEDEIFLQGHPREPGEVIVTSFHPDKYQPVPGGEPIRTSEVLPSKPSR